MRGPFWYMRWCLFRASRTRLPLRDGTPDPHIQCIRTRALWARGWVEAMKLPCRSCNECTERTSGARRWCEQTYRHPVPTDQLERGLCQKAERANAAMYTCPHNYINWTVSSPRWSCQRVPGDVRLRRHFYSPETDGYCMIAAPTWTRQSRTCPPAGPASAAPPPLYKDCERMAFPGCVAEPASVGVCRSVRGATSPLVVNLHY